MKHYIYTTNEEAIRMGGIKVKARIYRIKRNKPELVTLTTWNTASYKGEDSEVMNALIEAKELPKKYYGYYYDAPNTFRIFGV